jgi:hypothetical protein
MGCMVFGSAGWENSPWTLGEEEGLELLKKAYDLGINTWVNTLPPVYTSVSVTKATSWLMTVFVGYG